MRVAVADDRPTATAPDHPLANKEFLFPYATVVECPQADVLNRIGYTLAATALTEDPALHRRLPRLPAHRAAEHRAAADQPVDLGPAA